MDFLERSVRIWRSRDWICSGELIERNRLRRIAFRLLALIVVSALIGSPSIRAGERLSVTFERDVEPILTRAGCNAGACHGKARGQNGFALSLLGFDPNFDYVAIVKESGGRRVSTVMAPESLLLRKATARLPHGGGPRLTPGSRAYETVLRWIAAGMPRTPPDAPKLKRIAVEPTERTLKPIRVVLAARHGLFHRRVRRGRHGAGFVHVQ